MWVNTNNKVILGKVNSKINDNINSSKTFISNKTHLAPPMASISSKKMRQAFLLRAISNNSRTIRAPWKNQIIIQDKLVTLRKINKNILGNTNKKIPEESSISECSFIIITIHLIHSLSFMILLAILFK